MVDVNIEMGTRDWIALLHPSVVAATAADPHSASRVRVHVLEDEQQLS